MILFSKKIIRIFYSVPQTLLLILCLLSINSCEEEKPIPPSITSFSPVSGVAGTMVTISGTYFGSTVENNVVKFNGTTAVLTEATTESLTVTVPQGASTGKISITVGENSTSSEETFTVFKSPVITSIWPSSGLPGTNITISGSNFSTILSENEINFNGLSAVATTATAESISVTVPANASTGKITITVHGLTTTSTNDFLVPPTITGFSPSSGVVGSSLIITGTGFNTSIAANAVKINDRVVAITAATTTSLTLIVPAEASSGRITVAVSEQIAISTTDFTILPVVTSFSPAIGTVGASVTVTGTGFSSTPANNIVKVNNIAATVTNATTTSITLVVPAGATTGKISVTVGGNASVCSTDFEIKTELIKAGGSGYDIGNAVIIDSFGDIYITGYFNNTTSFGSTTLTSAGMSDIFLAKYNSDFELIWVKQIGGIYPDAGQSIKMDGSGNIFMTGYYGGPVNFGSVTLTASGRAFVAKFDGSGNVIWAKQINGTLNVNISKINLNNDGVPHVTGGFMGTATFGTSSLTSDGGEDIFLAKYNPVNGDLIWAKKFGGANDQHATSLSFNSSGEIYFAGSFFVNSVFGITTITAAGGLDAFLAKLNSLGEVIWVKQISGSQWENVLSIVLDGNENCYLTGYFTGTTNFDSSSLNSRGNEDVFLAKYNSSGTLIWAINAGGGSNYDNARSIGIDAQNNVYITGFFGLTATFGDKTLTSTNLSQDIFVAKYNSDGNIIWAKRAGGSDLDQGSSIVINSAGTVMVCGYFRGTGTTTFGSTSVNGSGDDDIFLWRIWQ